MKVVKLYDPTGASGRDVYNFTGGNSVTDVLMHEFPGGMDKDSVAITLNGSLLRLPTIDDDGEMIEEGDSSELVRELGDNDVVGIILETKELTTALLVATAILSVGAAIYAYSAIPDIPPPDSAKTSGSNNRLFGQTNSARPYEAIPDIYGKQTSYPDLITSEATTYYSQSKKQIRQYMAIGIGNYNLDSEFRLGGTLLSQIPGASATVYEPDANGDTIVEDYREQFSVDQIEGQDLALDGSVALELYESEDGADDPTLYYDQVKDIYVIAWTNGSFDQVFSVDDLVKVKFTRDSSGPLGTSFSLTALNGEYYVVNVMPNQIGLSLTQGADTYSVDANDLVGVTNNRENGDYIKKVDPGSGLIGPFDTTAPGQGILIDIEAPQSLPRPVDFDVTYVEIDAPGGTEIGSPVTETITMASPNFKNYVSFNQTFAIDITNNPNDARYYRVSILRTTPDYDVDPPEPDVTKWERLASFRNFPTKTFKNVTIVDVTIPQTRQEISPRKNKVNVDITRKTISYDTGTGSIINTLAPSTKFADAVLHEYSEVFDLDATALDLDELYGIQEDIDAIDPQLGEFSATLDDGSQGLEQRIATTCNVARVAVFRDGRSWRFVRDEAKSFVTGIITRRDLAADRNFSKTWRSRLPTEADGIKLEYTDPEFNKKAYIYRSIDGAGNIVNTPSKNPKTIQLVGCRNEAQAINRAELEVRRLLLDFWTVKDTLLSQGNLYDIGDLVRYNDVYKEDVFSGEILGVNQNGVATLSEDIDASIVNTGTHELTYTDEFGEVRGPFEVFASEATPNQVTIAGDNFADAVFEDATDTQLGSRFIITRVVPRRGELYVVREKRPDSTGDSVELLMTQYIPELYDAD